MSSDTPLYRALKDGLEGAQRSLERLRDDLHALELKCATAEVDMRAQITSTRQWLGSVAASVKGDNPLAQQIAVERSRLDALEAGHKSSDAEAVAKVGAKSKITIQLILTIGTVVTSLGALAVALLK